MLKQAFGQSKELQEEVVPLSNIFSNRLDDLIDSSNDKNVISRRQKKNPTSSRLPLQGRMELLVTLEWKRGLQGGIELLVTLEWNQGWRVQTVTRQMSGSLSRNNKL